MTWETTSERGKGAFHLFVDEDRVVRARVVFDNGMDWHAVTPAGELKWGRETTLAEAKKRCEDAAGVITKVCVNPGCGKLFQLSRSDRKFCSRRCGAAESCRAYRLRRKAGEQHEVRPEA